MNPGLTPAQSDRAAGVLLGTACGDALGVGYEFGPPLDGNHPVGMIGGGSFGWAPGEWTDDTSMAVAITEVTADGGSLRDDAARDRIARRWADWARSTSDVGVQMRSVLASAGSRPSAAMLAGAASAHHARTGRSGGNGSLMRTAPVALAFLHDPGGLDGAARALSALTHHDPEAGEACAVWCLAMRDAVLHGTFDGLRPAVLSLPANARNGWVVQAMQAAWSAISRTPVPGDDPGAGSFAAQHFQHALEAAVRGGRDTDTVAAIAGGLLGARWGASAVLLAWRRILHGWPGLRGRDLIALALCSARNGQSGPDGWPRSRVLDYSACGNTGALAIHPHDRPVLLGGVDAARKPPGGVDAVVSLCRLGSAEVPAPGVDPADRVEAWLTGSVGPGGNPNLDLVLVQAADTVAALRAEGRTVLVHCADAVSRTPAVAALYAARHLGIPVQQALRDVRAVLPDARPSPAFLAALDRLGAAAPATENAAVQGAPVRTRAEGGTMDRHLNVFVPYDRPPHHEDQLTRAAMIVMRAVPLARDALLARIGAHPSARLPEPELDMQARDVLRPPALGEADGLSLHQLISVFLSPDEGLDLSAAEIAERARGQRLDGVLRFGDELAVVIESKVVGEAPSDQARLLRLRGVEVKASNVIALGWHELLEDWWALLERGLLAPAERVLMEDLIAFTEEHFARLLPFTTLGRAGEHALRRERRLVALLREATGINEVEPDRRPWIGAVLMLDAAIGTKSIQRICLQLQSEGLALCTWPAELKPQAEALYRTGRAQRLIHLMTGNPEAWRARPEVHLAFRNAPDAQRLYLHCHLETAEYIRRWSGNDFAHIRAHHYNDIREDLWPWLRDRQYAGPEDDQQLDAFLKRLGHRDVHLRPGIEVRRIWPWPHAVDLDERGALAGEVRTAVAELLTALDEPLPPACTDEQNQRAISP